MLEKIGTGILTKGVLGFFKKVWQCLKNRHQKSKNASHDYGSHYKKRHGQLIATCVGMEPARALDDIYVAVQFLDKRRGATYRSTEDIEQAFRETEERHFASMLDKRQDGMRVANDEQYLMVIGDPGVGKSTFLRKVGLEALKGKDGSFEYECIPVFLELKRFTEDQIDIEAWITNEFKVCGYPYPEQMTNDALKSGELLILFDGFDEVPKLNANNVFNKIRDFVDQYSENHFIVSCRPKAYTGGLTGFAVVEVAEFDGTQIQAYINNWFALGSNREMETAQRCWEALDDPEYQAIRALAQNPLSLTLLCTIYEDSQSFPSNRAILYDRILNIFLKKWTEEKHVHRDPPVSPYLSILTVKEMLSEVAAQNFKADRVLFTEDELINQIQKFFQRDPNIPTTFDATKILDTILIDPGLFVERANGVYSFFHLMFQEYLTASYFVRTQSVQILVTEYLHDERWQEVFLFTAALIPKADKLLAKMEMEASKSINTDRLKMLFQWAKSSTDTSDDRYSGVAKRIFAIRQYFTLWMLNKIYKEVKGIVNRGLDLNQNFDRDSYSDLYLDRDLDMYLHRKGYRDTYLNRKLYRYQSLDSHLDLYINLNLYFGHKLGRGFRSQFEHNFDWKFDSAEHHTYREFFCYLNCYAELEFYLDPYFYQDPYQYMDVDFYHFVSSRLGEWLDTELDGRTNLLRRMGQMKIFKRVNLQQMARRFNEQRKFIKVARTGKPIESPEESIHNTWLSVLGITDDMLTISREEMENYIGYLRVVELILACKKVAKNVSAEVWQEIEDRFLTADAADLKN